MYDLCCYHPDPSRPASPLYFFRKGQYKTASRYNIRDLFPVFFENNIFENNIFENDMIMGGFRVGLVATFYEPPTLDLLISEYPELFF